MIIGYLMDQLANAAWISHARMVFGDHESLSGAQQLLNVEAGENALPPALFEGNAGQYTTQCVLEEQFPKYVAENSVSFSTLAFENLHTCPWLQVH